MNPLIIGNGLLGSTLHNLTQWDIISRKNDKIDICQISTYEHYFKRKQWDTIINCTGSTNTWYNQKEPHWSVNYKAVIDLVNLTNIYNYKLVHISTDYVYWNSISNAKEIDILCPSQNWYMLTKVLADAYVEAMSKNFLTIRTSYKPRPFPWDEAWNNMLGNFDYIDIIVPLITKLIQLNLCGIYNVGTKTKTMLELAQQTKPNIISKTRLNGNVDTTMNLDKMYNAIK